MYPEIEIFGKVMQTKSLMEGLGSTFAVIVTLIMLYLRFVKGKISFINLIKYIVVPDVTILIALMSVGTILGRAVRGWTHAEDGSMIGFRQAIDYGGVHFVGRVLAVVIIVPIVFRIVYKKDEFRQVLDIVAFFIPIQHIGNRLGCFFNGCCYGKPYGGIFAMKFPNVDYKVFPSQLFEVAMMVLILAIISIMYAMKKHTFEVTMLGFAVAIWISEKYIDKLGVYSYGGMTAIQYGAIFLAMIVLVIWILNFTPKGYRGKKRKNARKSDSKQSPKKHRK